MDYPHFADRKVLVTGGSSGIGRAIALGFAHAGADVCAAALDESGLRDLQQDATHQGLALSTQPMDVRNPAQVSALFDNTLAATPIDVVVHCAGITCLKTLTETTLDEYRDVVETNISGTYYCLQAAARHMTTRGRGGSIIVVTSINAFWPLMSQAVYTATKAAMEALAKALAAELAPYRIRVNTVAPGAVDTPMNSHLWYENQAEALARRIPLGRLGVPQDLVGAALFLASPWSEYMTGATIVVDGGFMVSR